MFYAKTQLNNEAILTLGIHEGNVFTRCPRCNREIAVELSEVFTGFDGALYSTNILCAECRWYAHKEGLR